MNAIFHIPDLTILNNIIILCNKQKKYPYAFYPNRIITEIYDAFCGCVWNGRTPLFNEPFLSIQDINQIKTLLEQNDLKLNLSWNNHLIENNQIYDTYCNKITELFHNGQHSITVSSLYLYEYLKKNYPNYTYYQSIITTDDQNNLQNLFNTDLIIAPRILNNNWNYLLTIPKEQRHQIEFLCNDLCPIECNRKEHYNIVNYCLSNFAQESTIYNHSCLINQDFKFYNSNKFIQTIHPNDIDKYIENGYFHFKLSSRRDDKIILLYKICKYLVKPEYFEDIYFSVLGG